MLDPFFSYVDKLATDFSWRRLSFLVAILVFVSAGLWVFEAYTDHFALRKLERATALLDELSDIERDVGSGSELYPIYSKLLADLEQLLPSGDSSGQGSIDVHPRIQNALYAALPWVLLSLFWWPGVFRGDSDNANTVGGFFVIATPIGVIAALVPQFEESWINHWLIPWGLLALFTVVVLVVDRFKK